MHRIRNSRVQTQVKIAIEVARKKEAQLPSQLWLVERKLRTDGIGSQSHFCGVLNPHDELQRVAVGFSCFRIRMIGEPVLEFQITDVLDQHDRVRSRCLEQPGNWKTPLKQQIS